MQLNTNAFSLLKRPARRAAAASDVAGYFAQGNPAASPPVPYTPVMTDFLNDLIDELKALLVFGGLTFSSTDQGQILKSVQHLLYMPTFTGGAATITARDTNSNGGLLTLGAAGSNNNVFLDNVANDFRVYTANASGNAQVLSYNVVNGQLNVASGNGGSVLTNSVLIAPDVNGNHVLFFATADGTQTGHILQHDGDGSIHINPGNGAEVVLDNQANLTAPNLTATGLVTSGAGGFQSGSGPSTTTGVTTIYGTGLQMRGGSLGGASQPITLQVIYNTATPFGGVPQSELWANGGLIAVDQNGAGYLRGQLGGAHAAVQIITTQSSEFRLKENIEELDGMKSLAALKAAAPYTFTYKPGFGFDTSVTHYGNIFEDVKKSMPQAAVVVNGIGQVNHAKTVPYMQAVILMQQQQIELLTARLDAMEDDGK